MNVCIVGASARQSDTWFRSLLDRGHEVVAACRERRMTRPAETDAGQHRAVASGGGPLVVLVPRGVHLGARILMTL